MARYTGAIWRPLTVSKGRRKMAEYNRMNVHVAVSEAKSLYGYFNQPRRPDSHFYVRRDGTVEQYVDTKYRANADLEGNDATISVETQGGTKNADTEQFSAAQERALAKLFAWVHKTHKIKLRLATSSKYGSASQGLSSHRLGIDGNFPKLPDVRAGRLQRGGGMHWSTSRGKLCPGGAKMVQLSEILRQAKEIVGTTVDKNRGWYHVVGVPKGDFLFGRSDGNLKAKVKTKRPNGFNLYIAKTVKKNDILWGVTNYGTWYSMAYLKKGKK